MKEIRPIITVDGPAASGKGTISSTLAKDFNLFHLETGLFYRIIGNEFYGVSKQKEVVRLLRKRKIKFFPINKTLKQKLYNEKVAENASNLAKLKSVRLFVLEKQIEILKTYPVNFNGIILDGRDCGTVIAPNANLKFYLNANLKVRAERRYKQLLRTNNKIKYDDILRDLSLRDQNDINRKNSPLLKADDANEIDCSYKNIEETIMIVKKIILSKLHNFNKKEGNN